MARKEYSDEVKAAVLAALLLGTPTGEIVKTYRVPAATIRSWKSRQSAHSVAIVATEKRTEVGELLVDLLRKGIRSLSLQVEHFGDKAWLKDQPAAEAAHVFGAVADRMFRLLEALEAGAQGEAPGSGEGQDGPV